jgi:hypothetical protein
MNLVKITNFTACHLYQVFVSSWKVVLGDGGGGFYGIDV